MDMENLYQLFCELNSKFQITHPEMSCVTTDSRNCPEASLFFALKGENFNGNAYAAKALEQGAAYAVIDEPAYALNNRFILVDNTLKALQQLAREHRIALGKPIIGITGTNGKTTTKELTAAVLSEKYNVHYTKGNLNNHIGVPLTLLQMTDKHDIGIIEMGASHPGDIKELVEIACPNAGIITNVGKAHLQGFGSFEGVMKTKGELYDYIRMHQGFIFRNIDNPYLREMAGDLPVHTYSLLDNAAEIFSGKAPADPDNDRTAAYLVETDSSVEDVRPALSETEALESGEDSIVHNQEENPVVEPQDQETFNPQKIEVRRAWGR